MSDHRTRVAVLAAGVVSLAMVGGPLAVAAQDDMAAMVSEECQAAQRPARARESLDRLIAVASEMAGGTYTADVWAHRGYAYLSSYRNRRTCPAKGVRVIDLRVPRRPRLVPPRLPAGTIW